MLNGLSFPVKLSDLVLKFYKKKKLDHFNVQDIFVYIMKSKPNATVAACLQVTLKPNEDLMQYYSADMGQSGVQSHEFELSLCSFTDPTQWGAFGIFFDAE